MSERRHAAQVLASRGKPVFPVWWATPEGGCACNKPGCHRPAKHPIVRHGVEDATTDRAVILHWWGRWPQANIGMATGRPSGLFVVDVDPRHDGYRTLAKLEAYGGSLDTLEVVTGSQVVAGPPGVHLYFELPEGVDLGNGNKPIRDRFGLGVDVRGSGGYVLTPPSGHVSGGRYTWGPGELWPVPGWLVELLTTPEPQPAPLAKVLPFNSPGRQLARFNRWLELVAGADEGQRNDRLFWAACRLRELQGEGAPEGWTDLLVQAGMGAGLSQAEAARTVRSGLKGRAS